MAITTRGETLDKEVVATKQKDGDDIVGLTVDELVTESSDIKSAKENTVIVAKELYDRVMSGDVPTRADQLPAYTPVQLVNMFYTLTKLPDTRIINTGYSLELEILMSKFLEDVVDQGGFNDLVEKDWSGLHQVATYGDFFVLAQTDILNNKKRKRKIKKGEKFVEYQGLSMGNTFFNRTATAIRSNSVSQKVTRCMFTTDMNIYMAEKIFPGITDIALAGNIPSTLQESNPTDESTDEQNAYDTEKSMQIGFFFDDVNEVYSIRAGSNNAEYAQITDGEYKKFFSIWWRGKQKSMIPISQLKMESRTEGIYSTGLIELFMSICVNEGLIQGHMVNNLLDINNAPMWINVDGAKAGTVLQQLRMGREKMRQGERAVLFPNGTETTNANSITENDVQYLKPESATEDNERTLALFDKIIRRMGWNLDINFSDPNKTLGQTELDIQSVNRTISNFWTKNTDFVEFNNSFAIDRIIKLGDENDDTVFGRDIKIDVSGEQVPLNELTGGDITVGFIVKLFKEAKENMRLEIDTQSGTAFNDLLEMRNLQRRKASAIPGSPEFLRILSAESVLNGGKPLTQSDVQGQGEAQPAQPLPELPE